MHHKRKRHPAARAGCAMCKPQKKGWGKEDTISRHKGFANQRNLAAVKEELLMMRFI